MAFRVVTPFTDLQDNNHVYKTGDAYPRKGRAKKERVEELSTVQNLRGVVLIEEVKEDE